MIQKKRAGRGRALQLLRSRVFAYEFRASPRREFGECVLEFCVEDLKQFVHHAFFAPPKKQQLFLYDSLGVALHSGSLFEGSEVV